MFSSKGRTINDSFSKNRASKNTSSKSKRSFKDQSFLGRRPADLDLSSSKVNIASRTRPTAEALASTVITVHIGHAPSRIFAAHEDVLGSSPFFQSALKSHYYHSSSRTLYLPDEIPEIFSSVLEFLYKGDYFPRLLHDPHRNTWSLENSATSPGNSDSAVCIPPPSPSAHKTAFTQHPAFAGSSILKDTAVYCTAERYGLPALKRLALRKQGLQSGIPVGTILASARYAYAHTPESDSKLRAHYLHLIIRSRNTFKRSGTMQTEMGCVNAGAAIPVMGGQGEEGTGLWFDLFVAMCNHLDDMEKIVAKSPRT